VSTDNESTTAAGAGVRSRSRLVTLKWLGALGILALLATGCGDDKPLNTFEPRGPHAERIDNLMTALVYIMLIVGFGVMFVVLYIVFKNRVNGDTLDPNDLPEQTHGKPILEVAWTIAPGLILAAVAVPTAATIVKLEEKNDPVDGIDVMVIGQQWWWEYRYDVNGNGFFLDLDGDGNTDNEQRLPLEVALDPEDVVVANELVFPVGEQIDLIITSRDVIHSYWIPRLNGKRDAVPGRLHTWSIEANEQGKYTGWCTEFCGLSHARMRMSAIALPKAEYEQWLANQMKLAEIPTDPDAMAGRAIFADNCSRCHAVNDGELDNHEDGIMGELKAGAAPNLTHFATRSVYAGAIFSQYSGPGTDASDDALDVSQYLRLAEIAAGAQGPDDLRWDTDGLKDWISDAPSQKDMAPDDQRGMPAFPQFDDEQLDQIVAYLATLD